jgi:SRSO17 transposase
MAKRVEIVEQNFMAYLERLTAVVGHADRHEPLRAYLEGLLLPGDRKSVEPMAARIDPRNVRSRHQSMHHFVATSPWDGQEIIRVARGYALEEF